MGRVIDVLGWASFLQAIVSRSALDGASLVLKSLKNCCRTEVQQGPHSGFLVQFRTSYPVWSREHLVVVWAVHEVKFSSCCQ